MRMPPQLRTFALLAAQAAPVLLFAQFQAPINEELKMTADPKAPGAAAVYLEREETTDDTQHFHTYYDRIKVLSEAGKGLATITVPYIPAVMTVNDIQGRTIHADGSITPLTEQPADLMDFKSGHLQVNSIVFTLPNVDVGSILEYRLRIRFKEGETSAPHWDIQQKYFVHHAHYAYHPTMSHGGQIISSSGTTLGYLLHSEHLPQGVTLDLGKKDTYNLDLTDIPPLPNEEWMPPLNTFRWKVVFYYSYYFSSNDFWARASASWAKFAVDFPAPTSKLREDVSRLVAPADTDEQKARKIYTAVQNLENTDFTRTKSAKELKEEKIKDIKKVEDVWREQRGTANEIALLYVALARSAGLKASPVQVVSRDRGIFDINYLSSWQLDADLAVVNLNGKDLYLDPGQKMCPFGSLHWKHALASGFGLSGSEAMPIITPGITYKSARVDRVADLAIDAHGTVSGSVRFILSGPEALKWRQLSLQNDEEEVKKQFNESVQDEFPAGVHADFDHFLALKEYEGNLIAIVKISGDIGSATGKRIFLPGLFFASRAKHPFVLDHARLTPIDVEYPMTESDDVTYHLPNGFTVESVPLKDGASWPDHAVLQIKATPKTDAVTITRDLVYNFTLLAPKDYTALSDFYRKVAAADQQQLVLIASPAGKGN